MSLVLLPQPGFPKPAMKSFPLLLLIAITGAGFVRAESTPPPVDFDKASQIIERMKNGGQVTGEEQADVERAKAERANKPGSQPADAAPGIDWDKAKKLYNREQRGDPLTADEQAYLDKAKAARGQGPSGGGANNPGPQRKALDHLTPLCDMGATDRYEGEDGGLYGGGDNRPPAAHREAAAAALARIQPLDPAGKPAADGRVVLVSISMSNATMEFSTFKRIADQEPQKSEKLTIVDCAQGGQAMAEWAAPDARPWAEAMNRLGRAGVTPRQVQVAWVKLANKGPAGSLREHCGKLETDTLAVLQIAKGKFPNLRIAYLGSRIFAGYATSGLNPEPYAFEGAFAVRSLIRRQLKGDAKLAVEKSPLLLWGPYLWADGIRGRKADGLVWTRGDFGGDGTHPSQSGQEKVAKLLLDFFSTDPLAKNWFAR